MSLKYGFFNSVLVQTGVDGNDDPVYEYDRTYTADDHNTYFDGLVVRNGIYNSYDKQFRVGDTQAEIDENNGTVTYTDPDTGDEVTLSDGYIAIQVHKGKGTVNGHWVINDSDETLYLEPREPALTRVDMVVLRYRLDQRDVILTVKKGVPSATANALNGTGIPNQYGYIPNPETYLSSQGYSNTVISELMKNSDVYFEPEDSETYGSVLELCLALIEIPPRSNSSKNISVRQMQSTSRCPFISHLAQADRAKEDADKFMNQYTTAVQEWWDAVQEGGSMKANLTTIRYRISATHSNIVYISGANAEIPDYQYVIEDTVNLYFNGLYLEPGEDYDIIPDQSGAFYVALNTVTQITDENVLSFVIYKGTSIAIPDASSIKY